MNKFINYISNIDIFDAFINIVCGFLTILLIIILIISGLVIYGGFQDYNNPRCNQFSNYSLRYIPARCLTYFGVGKTK